MKITDKEIKSLQRDLASWVDINTDYPADALDDVQQSIKDYLANRNHVSDSDFGDIRAEITYCIKSVKQWQRRMIAVRHQIPGLLALLDGARDFLKQEDKENKK